MRIQIRVVPGSSGEKIERLGDGTYKVWVMPFAEKGKATHAVQKALAAHFKVRMKSVFVQHTTHRLKWVDIVA